MGDRVMGYFVERAIGRPIHGTRYTAGATTPSSAGSVRGWGRPYACARERARFVRLGWHTTRPTAGDTDPDTAPGTGADLAISPTAGFAYPAELEIATGVMPTP